jgi:hypothetical protein
MNKKEEKVLTYLKKALNAALKWGLSHGSFSDLPLFDLP